MMTIIVASVGLGSAVFALTGDVEMGRRAGFGLFGVCALAHAVEETYYRFVTTAPQRDDE